MQTALLSDEKTGPLEEEASLFTYLKNMAESFRGREKEQRQEYKIHLNGKIQPKEVQHQNRINVMQYRIYVDQLREFRWLYFLGVALAAYLDSSLHIYAYLLLFYIFYLLLTDTLKLLTQFQLQKKINREIYKFRKNIWFFYKYQDIEVGHILELSQHQVIPNDMVILYCAEKQVFLQDEQGRVHQKESVSLSQEFVEKDPQKNKFHDLNYYLLVRRDGSISLVNKSVLGQQAQLQVVGDNVMPKYHRLVSEQPVFGMVIKNWNDVSASSQATKQNHLQRLVKTQVPYCIALLMTLSLSLHYYLKLHTVSPQALLVLVTFDTLLSLDLALVLLDQFFRDTTREECRLTNGNLVSKLDEVKYLVVNQTEALVRDKPRVKMVAVGGETYSSMDIRLMKSLLKGPPTSEKQCALESLLECVVVNNRVKEEQYSCDPLDNVFLDLAGQLRYKLLKKDAEQVKYVIEHRGQDIQHYKIHYSFQHSHRQLTLIYDFDLNRYILFSKGPLAHFREVLSEQAQHLALLIKDQHAQSHMHIVFFGKKVISEEDFLRFDSKYKEGLRLGMEKKQLEEKLIRKIERKVDLVGAIGVEETVAHRAKETLSAIKAKHIRPWVVSHMCPESTLLLGRQLGLAGQKVFSMLLLCEFIQIQNSLNELDSKNGQYTLLIDHSTLKQCLRFHKRFFFEVSAQAPSVLLADVQGNLSTVQKLKEGLVRKLKVFTTEGVMAIGTCNQDMAMLQTSDLGIAVGRNRLCRLVSEIHLQSLDDLTTLLSKHAPQYQARSLQLYSWAISRAILVTATHLLLFYRHSLTSSQHVYFTLTHSCLSLYLSFQTLLRDRQLSSLHGLSVLSTLALSVLYTLYQVFMLVLLTQALPFSQPQQVLLISLCLLCLDLCNLSTRIYQLSVPSCLLLLLLLSLHVLLYPLFFPDLLSLLSQDLFLTLLQVLALTFLPVYVIRSGVGCFTRK